MDIYSELKKYTEYQNGVTDIEAKLIFEDITLEKIKFKGFDINYSSFLEVVFNNCDFTEVYMNGASLCGSSFLDCTFNNNKFRKGNAEYTNYIKTNLIAMDSFRTSFYKSTFENVMIEEGTLNRSWFESTNLSNVSFIKTDLSEVDFSNSIFCDVKFEDCIFSNTSFNKVNGLSNTTFNNCTITINDEVKKNIGNKIKQML